MLTKTTSKAILKTDSKVTFKITFRMVTFLLQNNAIYSLKLSSSWSRSWSLPGPNLVLPWSYPGPTMVRFHFWLKLGQE